MASTTLCNGSSHYYEEVDSLTHHENHASNQVDHEIRNNPPLTKVGRLGVILSIVSLVVCAIAVCVLFVHLDTVQTHDSVNQEVNQNFNVCVMCPSAAEYSVNSQKIKMYDLEHDLKRCCAENGTQLTALLNLLAEPRYRVPRRDFSISGASAHKCLVPSTYYPNLFVPKFLEKNQNVPLNLTLTIRPTIEHVRNVEVVTSGLQLLHDGMYYVYSMVNFKPDSSRPCGWYDRQIWEQSVIRTKPNDPEKNGPILTGYYTCGNDSRDSVSVFISGTFYLHHGDKLSVEVSGYGLVNFHLGSSYIGVWMVGQSDGAAASVEADANTTTTNTTADGVTEVGGGI